MATSHSTFKKNFPPSKELLNCTNNVPVMIPLFLELCLTSNVKCGTAESYKKHHFVHLFSVKHPVVLAVSTDKMNSYCVCHVNISNKTT